MTNLRLIPLDKFQGAMTIAEHAIAVTDLLNVQDFVNNDNVEDSDICPIVQGTLLLKLRTLVEESASSRSDLDNVPIRSGSQVSTRNAKVCPTGEFVVSRHNRQELIGHVIKQSPYFIGFWLVYFNSMKIHYYVSDKHLKLISKKSVTSAKDKDLDADQVQKCSQEDKDMILFCVLNNKIHHTEDHSKYSIQEIVERFSPYFPWFTKQKLQKFINKHRKALYPSKFNSTDKSKSTKSPDSVINEAMMNKSNTASLNGNATSLQPSRDCESFETRSELKICLYIHSAVC